MRGYVAFDTKTAALAFERSLKHGSGQALRKKRLWWLLWQLRTHSLVRATRPVVAEGNKESH
jgi:hypothetical protein